MRTTPPRSPTMKCWNDVNAVQGGACQIRRSRVIAPDKLSGLVSPDRRRTRRSPSKQPRSRPGARDSSGCRRLRGAKLASAGRRKCSRPLAGRDPNPRHATHYVGRMARSRRSGPHAQSAGADDGSRRTARVKPPVIPWPSSTKSTRRSSTGRRQKSRRSSPFTTLIVRAPMAASGRRSRWVEVMVPRVARTTGPQYIRDSVKLASAIVRAAQYHRRATLKRDPRYRCRRDAVIDEGGRLFRRAAPKRETTAAGEADGRRSSQRPHEYVGSIAHACRTPTTKTFKVVADASFMGR